MLPELEQTPLYNAMNFSTFTLVQAQNTTGGYTQLASLLCPSESISQRPGFPWATSSYVNNQGGPGPIAAWTGVVVPGPNLWTAGQNGNIAPFSFASVTDGTSNTAMFSERLIGIYEPSGGPYVGIPLNSNRAKRALYQLQIQLTADQGIAGIQAALNFISACKSLPGSTVSVPYTYTTAFDWHSTMAWLGTNISYFHFMTPNSISCADTNAEGVAGAPWGGSISAISANSNHPGGINVGFADGSVKFIKDTISLPTWWALGTRNGGEVISADSY
jgi:prepilin-type processing-associated H-X9-DG protein